MSIRPLILKNGIITPTRSAADIEELKTALGISTSNFVDTSSNQTINGIKTFSGSLRLPSSEGSLAGHIWRSGDALQYRDGANVTKTILNSAGNLSNLADKQVSLNNLVGVQTANRVLRSNGTNVTLSQVALDTDVINVLSMANGGTGSNTQNFVDLTTAQSIGGNKTLSGILTITNSTASTSTTTGGLIVVGGIGADHIKVKNAWLHEVRSSVTGVLDANALVFTNFAGTKWVDGGTTNLNLPVNAGMISQFDSLFGTAVESKYRVQEFLNVGTGTNARFWKRTENNGVWGTWLEIAFLEKANTWIGIASFSNASVNMTNLPTSSTGLAAGRLWRNGNVINIV